MPALLTRTSSAPKSFSVVCDHVGDLGGLGHVGARIERLDAELLLDAGALFLDRGLVAEAVDHDVGAVLGERARDGEPDAGGGTGDHRGLSFQHGVTSSNVTADWSRRDPAPIFAAMQYI